MLRKPFIGLTVILIALMTGTAGAASSQSWNLATIETPEQGQQLFSAPVEITVKFEDGAGPANFQAWLNQKEVTDKFQPTEGGMRALLGLEDGLTVLREAVETTRDEKGVWFITGSSKRGASAAQGRNILKTKIKARGDTGRADVDVTVFFADARLYDACEAMGYAVATDRLWQAETYRRQARGRLSEILGADLLGTDIYFRTLFYSDQELQALFDALDPEIRGAVNGYVSGFNRRIAEVRSDPSLLPFEFTALGFSPEDWTALDVVAWAAVLQRLFDSEALDTTQLDNAALYVELMEKFPGSFQGMFDDLRWINDPDALTYIPGDTSTEAQARSRSKPLRKTAVKKTGPAIPDLRNVAKTASKTRKEVVESLKKINAYVKLGSYAWTVSGAKTESGNPIIYSGPQMGFSVPSIVLEGSVRAAGLDVSGMTVAGIPFIIIGRTPHHAWSMQVGCDHTVDYYLENPSSVTLNRVENIKVAGMDDVQLPIYRSAHGPVINPMPYDPATYDLNRDGPIVAWKYSQWGYESTYLKAGIDLARATSMDEFGKAVELVNFSIHYCYADRDGNIAYWMSGRDPVRPNGEWRLPQGFAGPALEWDSGVLIPRSTDRNTSKGFYSGWNNKSRPDYDAGFNSRWLINGPFHIAHAIDDYLSSHNNLTFEEVRDLALNIATTDFIRAWGGGNPWKFVKDDFTAAVQADPSPERLDALQLLADWDGHFVAGGESAWVRGPVRADAWVLMDEWIKEALRLTFEDELGPDVFARDMKEPLFNVLLHGLAGPAAGVVNTYDWFVNLSDAAAPQSSEEIILTALDNVLAALGARPWGMPRTDIVYSHDLLGEVWRTPFSNRSTYAHVVELGPSGPIRIESMFPLGESGTILMGENLNPVFDEHFFSMTPEFDGFAPRNFPRFH
jgi:penicillin amidase